MKIKHAINYTSSPSKIITYDCIGDGFLFKLAKKDIMEYLYAKY